VLSLLFPHNGELQLLLMKRTEDGRAHSGQVSFPGGRQDPTDADLRATALREAQEEVGIMSSEVDILGQLTTLYIPVSNFQVYPFVAFSASRPEYNLSHSEVASIIEVPLTEFLKEERKVETVVTSPADPTFIRKVSAYQLEDGSIIWGATAMILSELEVILSEILSPRN
jgi:8-oxo-dGTP pyrophosphatase MutT (NUDIX family)